MKTRITLVGNANVGKTSIFNAITHSNNHVGNWHGVTVDATSKDILYRHRDISVEDLPGIYSLSVYAGEELVSRKAILSKNYDAIVNVCEVNNLPRNLYLTLQLLELGLPVIVGINMVDELKKLGKNINYRFIEERLGVPVIPVSAKYHSDIHLLLDVVIDSGIQTSKNPAVLDYLDALPLGDIQTLIGPNAAAAELDVRWAAIKVMDGDKLVLDALGLDEVQLKALGRYGDMQERIASARYSKIDSITKFAITSSVTDEHHEMHEHMRHSVPIEPCAEDGVKDGIDEKLAKEHMAHGQAVHFRHHDRHKANRYTHGYSKIDKILLNKYLALPLFLVIMAAIFYLTFGLFGALMSTGLDWLLQNGISNPVHNGLTAIDSPAWVTALITDGVIGGVGGILTFLPQILLLFLFLSLMEDTGYMSRVAFMTDGFFRKIGLSGKSAFTMLMGFGCSATAVLTARNLEDPKIKIKTIMLTPFMSCSARLPVYATLGGLFFLGTKPFLIFGLYLLGVAVSLIWAAIFNKIKSLKTENSNFIMEMPPYRFPTMGRVWRTIWTNMKAFLIRVGTLIFAVNVIVWVLSNFSFVTGFVGTNGGTSIMQSVAGFLSVLFVPLGWGNWRAATALISGLVAKEIVVTTLQSFGDMQVIMWEIFPTTAAAFSFLVFVLLYVPCIATIGAVAREIGGKWAAASVAMQLGSAYVVSLASYWIGVGFSNMSIGAAVATILGVAVLLAAVAIIVHAIRSRSICQTCAMRASCSKTKKRECTDKVESSGDGDQKTQRADKAEKIAGKGKI